MSGRDQIAAFLLARDEDYAATPNLLAWAERLIEAGRAAEHGGDCTKKSHTCLRCTADRALADADRIIGWMPDAAATPASDASAIQAMLEPRRAEQEHRRYLDASRRADTYRKERDMWKGAAEAEAAIGKELLARAEKAEAACPVSRPEPAATPGNSDLRRAWDTLMVLAVSPVSEWRSKAEIHQEIQWIRLRGGSADV